MHYLEIATNGQIRARLVIFSKPEIFNSATSSGKNNDQPGDFISTRDSSYCSSLLFFPVLPHTESMYAMRAEMSVVSFRFFFF